MDLSLGFLTFSDRASDCLNPDNFNGVIKEAGSVIRLVGHTWLKWPSILKNWLFLFMRVYFLSAIRLPINRIVIDGSMAKLSGMSSRVYQS
jgi:hypothetical protein